MTVTWRQPARTWMTPKESWENGNQTRRPFAKFDAIIFYNPPNSSTWPRTPTSLSASITFTRLFVFFFFFIQLLSHFLAYTKILFKVIYYYYYYYFLGRGPIHIYKLDISNQSLKYITCKRQNIHDNIEVDQRLSNANLQVNSTNREILAPPMENEGSSLHMISAYANVCQRQLQLRRELCSNMSLL